MLGLLILGLSFGCQKDIIETENANGPVSLSATAVQTNAKINNFMVIAKTEKLPADIIPQLSEYGEIVKSIPEIGVVVMKPSVSNFETKVAEIAGVMAVMPDLMARWIEPTEFVPATNPPSIGSDEPYFPYQWGMDAIDAPEAWNEGWTGIGARVFILDTGIDADNPELAANLNTTLCKSFVPGENYDIAKYILNEKRKKVYNYFNHGTHVAGIIAAGDNGMGVIGVAPETEIVAVKVLSEYTGSGYFSWIIDGIVYAADNGADVINMSLGALVSKNGFYIDENGVLQKEPAVYIQSLIQALQRALNYAFDKGAVVVASAGNDSFNADGSSSLISIPADLSNVIAVSATAPVCWILTQNPVFDFPASYTDFGRSMIDLAAPGGDYVCVEGYPFDMVLSTCPGPSYYFAAGTSMASPHVAGVAALIIGKNGGEMNPADVAQQLFSTADNIDGNGASLYYGKGRVNAFRAVTE